MNLERRIAELEQQAGGGEEPVLLVLVGMVPGGSRREAVGFATDGRKWMRRLGESRDQCLDRISAELQAEGLRMLPLLSEAYEEATA